MPARRKTHLLEEAAQREALTSPVRLELIEHLGQVGPASVRTLAERMDRSPHALHYHVRRLVEVGLVVQTGTARSGRRDEALFDVVADRFELPIEPHGGAVFESELRTVRAVLRRAERDFTALAETAPERLGGGDGFTGRLRARLSRRGRDDVMRHLRAIQRVFADELRRDHPPQTHLETYTLTTVFLPEAP